MASTFSEHVDWNTAPGAGAGADREAQADIRGLASATSAWGVHMGVLPSALAVLTAIATNAQNITAGPFMAAIPTPPSTAWGSTSSYAINAALGTFTISAAGDGATVSAP